MSVTPESATPTSCQPYVPPRITPLGKWTALTLLISVPIGPGTGVFDPNPVYSGGK